MDKYTIERIKSAARIEEVIGDFYTLKKRGAYYTCLCPFHDDHRLGSFKISPSKNIYKCFACGAGGDSVDFLMKHEGISFWDAIRWLGRKYGIDAENGGFATHTDARVKPEPRPLPPPLPTMYFKDSLVSATEQTADNTFCNYLRQLPWLPEQAARVEDVLREYHVGNSREGHVVFWQLDANGNAHTGKLMRYGTDGHRDKQLPGSVDWVHSRLGYDEKNFEVEQVLFGETKR